MKYNAESFNSHKTLKSVREKSGMSQKDFAEAIGITESDLKNFENRDTKKGISIKNYLSWCDHLDCDINYFLGINVEPTDVCGITGLDPVVVETLKKEKNSPTTSAIRSEKNSSISGITTADLFNALLGYKGVFLKEVIHQYTREKMIFNLLDDSVNNIVNHRNSEVDKKYSTESVIQYADTIMSNIRLESALSSLTIAGRKQNLYIDDYSNFYYNFKIDGYSKDDIKVIFDYMQSRSRVEALRMKCFDLMMQFLDALSEDSQLKYHSKKMGDYDITASILYKESVDTIEQAKNEMMTSAIKREMTKLKANNNELKSVNQKLIEDNNLLSIELNTTRAFVRSLRKELKELKSGSK